MIIFENLGYMTRSDWPSGDWTGRQAKYAVDDGSELAALVMAHSPWFVPIENGDGELVGITPTEPPEEQEQEQQPSVMDLIADIYARLAEAEIAPIEEIPEIVRESVSLATERITIARQDRLQDKSGGIKQ